MSFMMSYGVYARELDFSSRVRAVNTTTGAIVFESKMGPTTRQYITSPEQFVQMYGTPNPSLSGGPDAALAFLDQSVSLWCVRVQRGARIAGATAYNEPNYFPSFKTVLSPWPAGTGEFNDYTLPARKITFFEMYDDLDDDEIYSVSVDSDDNKVYTIPYNSATSGSPKSSKQAYLQFMSLISAKLNAKFPSYGTVDRARYEARYNQHMSYLVFSRLLTSSMSLSGTVAYKGLTLTITATPYVTSHNATLDALAAKIDALLTSASNIDGVFAATVDASPDATTPTNDNRVIRITSPEPGESVYVDITVTGASYSVQCNQTLAVNYITFPRAIATGESVVGTIKVGNNPTRDVNIPFTTNSNNTVNLVSARISAIIQEFFVGFVGTEVVDDDPARVAVDDIRRIRVIWPNYDTQIAVALTIKKANVAPVSVYYSTTFGRRPAGFFTFWHPRDDASYIYGAKVLTGPGSSPTPQTSGAVFYSWIDDKYRLFDVYALNQGIWGNDIGVSITNVVTAKSQTLSMKFSAAFQISNTFSCLINGDAMPDKTVTMTGMSSDQFVQLIANKIVAGIQKAYPADAGNVRATVTHPAVQRVGTDDSGAPIYRDIVPNDDREIIFVAPNNKVDLRTVITNIAIGKGTASTAPTAALTVKQNAQNASALFTLSVFNRSQPELILETFNVTVGYYVDGNGKQLNIAQQVNDPLTGSAYIRIYQTANPQYLIPNNNSAANIFLSGGTDGADITDAEYFQGWDQFSNREEVGVRILINGGYTDPDRQRYMVALAEQRRDCMAVLDVPSEYQTAQNAVEYRNVNLNVNSSYAALYTPDLYITDKWTGIKRYVSPSGHVAGTFAYTDRTRETWFSPAGVNRGKLNNVDGLRYLYTRGDMDLLTPNQVNPIISKRGKGIFVWGDDTLQYNASALSNVNVRRLMIFIETSLVDALDNNVFDPNDQQTRFLISQMINSFLQPIKNGRGLYDFLTVCDDTNNKPETIDAGELHVDVYLKPTIPAKKILLTSVLTTSGASFQELVDLGVTA